MATCRVRVTEVRPGYEQLNSWTYGEAAEQAGVTIHTVREWQKEGNFQVANAKGPFRVDVPSFMRFVRTGKPQT